MVAVMIMTAHLKEPALTLNALIHVTQQPAIDQLIAVFMNMKRIVYAHLDTAQVIQAARN